MDFFRLYGGQRFLYNGMTELMDPRQVASNNMIVAFLQILSNMAYTNRSPTKERPGFNAKPGDITFTLFGHALSSVTDGSGWKMRFSKSQKQWIQTGGAPLMTIQVYIHLLFF